MRSVRVIAGLWAGYTEAAGGGPASFSVRIVAVFQALNQFGRHCCSLFIREVERLGEELFGVHKQEGTTV
jgi:hypothetical protein